MFEKIYKIFRELPNIVDDLLAIGYDIKGADHNKTLCRILQVWRRDNFKLNNKDKGNFRHTSYDKRRPLHLETYLSRVGLGAELLQIRKDMNCLQDIAPDNTILRLTAFASKSLSSA